MKLFLRTFVFVFILSSCTSNRYVLLDNNEDKDFLKELIKEYKQTLGILNKPIIVLDGIPYRYSHELKEKPLPITKSDIKEINVLKNKVGRRIYGEFAKDGVILITTKTKEETKVKPTNSESDFYDKKILFIVDGKTVERKVALSLDPNDIETLTVIKKKESILEYTSEEYDGVIIIETKN